MILSAHQPAYLPWQGFFHKIIISDVFVLLDNVQFEKNSYINRNKIKTSQGELWLTIPILSVGHLKKTISDMEINCNQKWRKKHLKSIQINYLKSPFFTKYQDYFEKLYHNEWIYLIDILNETLKFFITKLRIKTKIYHQSDLGFKLKKQNLILEMCEYFNADMFVFGKLGRDYVESNLFHEKNIKLYFQDFKTPIYPQLYSDFIPNLSIIDLLFNVGSEKALEIIMQDNVTKNELVEIIEMSK